MKRMGTTGLALVACLWLVCPVQARAEGRASPQEVDSASGGPDMPRGRMVAELTDEERERLEELERQIKKEEEQAYKEGVKKGRTNAAIWGCVTSAAVVTAFYVITLVGLLA